MNIHDKNHLSDIKDSWHQRDVRSGDSPISAWWYASIATFSEQNYWCRTKALLLHNYSSG